MMKTVIAGFVQFFGLILMLVTLALSTAAMSLFFT